MKIHHHPLLLLLLLLSITACAPRLSPVPVQGPEPADPRAGRMPYMKTGCFQCHGLEGRGDGVMAASLKVPPRDFRKADAFRGGSSVREIAFTVKYAGKWRMVTNQNMVGMPDFSAMKDDELMSVSAYVKWLQTNRLSQ